MKTSFGPRTGNATVVAVYTLDVDYSNDDWEDLAAGPCSDNQDGEELRGFRLGILETILAAVTRLASREIMGRFSNSKGPLLQVIRAPIDAQMHCVDITINAEADTFLVGAPIIVMTTMSHGHYFQKQ